MHEGHALPVAPSSSQRWRGRMRRTGNLKSIKSQTGYLSGFDCIRYDTAYKPEAAPFLLRTLAGAHAPNWQSGAHHVHVCMSVIHYQLHLIPGFRNESHNGLLPCLDCMQHDAACKMTWAIYLEPCLAFAKLLQHAKQCSSGPGGCAGLEGRPMFDTEGDKQSESRVLAGPSSAGLHVRLTLL